MQTERYLSLLEDCQRAVHEVAGKAHIIGFCVNELQDGNLNFKKLYRNLNEGTEELFEIIDFQSKYFKKLLDSQHEKSLSSVLELSIDTFKLRNWKKKDSLVFSLEEDFSSLILAEPFELQDRLNYVFKSINETRYSVIDKEIIKVNFSCNDAKLVIRIEDMTEKFTELLQIPGVSLNSDSLEVDLEIVGS